MISEEGAARIDEAGVDEVLVRSPLTCEARYGVCRACYGRNLATGEMVGSGEAVGIIAAQSIGEPGTQLTMRTFHTGGVAGLDITAGLPRVEELFEARIPKGKAEISHIDGVVEIIRGDGMTKVKVVSTEVYDTTLGVPKGAEQLAAAGDTVALGQVIARSGKDGSTTEVTAPVAGFLVKTSDGLAVRAEDVVEREYLIPHNAKLLVENGQQIRAGDAITDGPINPQEYLDTRGKDAVQRYLVREVQKVYKSQGVTINDKHIEIIVRQMLRKVRIDQPGDVDLLPTELVDRLEFEEHNNQVLAEGGEPATAQTVLLGVTKASLNTSSFLAAASFQETTRVLTEAAINGAKDHLIGLKENVIIGKLIPAGSGAPANVAARKARERQAALEALAGEALEGLGEAEYNPFLEDGRADRDEETAGLALAATIAGKDGDADGDGDEVNPFLAGRCARRRGRCGQPVRRRGREGGRSRLIAERLADPRPRGDPRPSAAPCRQVSSQSVRSRARRPGAPARPRTFDTVPGRRYTPPSWPREGSAFGACADAHSDSITTAPVPAGPPRGAIGDAGPAPAVGYDRPVSTKKEQRLRADDQPARATWSPDQDQEGQGARHAQELEQPATPSGVDPGRPAEAWRLSPGAHDDAEEAELGAPQDRPRSPVEPDGGHGLHPGHRPQPPGALGGPRPRWAREGPPVGQVPHHPRHPRRRRRARPQARSQQVRREGQVGEPICRDGPASRARPSTRSCRPTASPIGSRPSS